MKARKIVVIAMLAALGATAGSSWAVDPDPEANDMDPGVVAKMARLKHKNLDGGSNSPDGQTVRVNANSLFGQCGSVNIGNVVAPQQRIGPQPREINVIVTGSVVNSNNRCN